ncbi:hypothetical protein [Rhizobium sp. BR 249]|uniref:hypothetical protein n=1 Tax=Rhizobium sp. BR 249 TaxID=3040011 RepID=UPI0039BF1609
MISLNAANGRIAMLVDVAQARFSKRTGIERRTEPREASMPTRYRCVPTRHNLVNVVDRQTGRPAEVGATAILLERHEARCLIAWLLRRARAEDAGNQIALSKRLAARSSGHSQLPC